MKRWLIIFGMLLCNILFGQSSFVGGIYTGMHRTNSPSITETNSHDFVLSPDLKPYDHVDLLFIYKLDSLGNVKWGKQILNRGGSPHNINELNDSNYLITALGTDNSALYSNNPFAVFTKTDTSGNILWDKRIGDTIIAFQFHDMIIDLDGGFSCVGLKDSLNTTSGEFTKFDSSGNIVFQKNYLLQSGTLVENDFLNIAQSVDSSYFVLAYVQGIPTFIHFNYLGDSLSSNSVPDTITPNEEDRIWYLKRSGNKLISLISTMNTLTHINEKFFYSTLDITSGNIQNKIVTNPGYFIPVDNNMKIVSTICNNNFGSSNEMIQKRDSDENVIWSYCLNPNYEILPGIINICHDNGIIFTGTIDTSNAGLWQSIYYLKLDSSGQLLTSNISMIEDPGSIKIYPNPVSDRLFINSETEEIENLRILNTLGEEILKFNYNPHQIDLRQLQSGIYFIEIKTKNGMIVKKFIRE